MKKQAFILWIASFIIVFVSIYVANILDDDYPITSTFGIDGKKVSYRFEKVHYGSDDIQVIIRTDLPELTGKVFWRNNADSILHFNELKKSDLILFENILALHPEQKLKYYIKLYYKDKTFTLPENEKVEITFFGKIPSMLIVLENLLLYLGLTLAIRTGLEYFNNGEKSKKFGTLTAVLFLTLIALINPLYLTYKFGFMNHSIPPISKLFLWSDISIFILWVSTLIIIFSFGKYKFLPLVSAILCLLIVILFR